MGVLIIEIFQCLLRDCEGSVTLFNPPEKCNQPLLTKGLRWAGLCHMVYLGGEGRLLSSYLKSLLPERHYFLNCPWSEIIMVCKHKYYVHFNKHQLHILPL